MKIPEWSGLFSRYPKKMNIKKQVFVWLTVLMLLLTHGVYAELDLSALPGKNIGVQTGTTFDKIVLEAMPDAKISYFNTVPDLAAALEAYKIDAFPGDEPALRLMAAENDRLEILDGRLDNFEFGFVLPKTADGEKLTGELNTWLRSMKASGELDEILRKWTDGPESEKTMPDYHSLSVENGKLKMVTEGAYAPMNYFRDNEIVGMEIDMAVRFCQANGYGLTVESLNFDGILPAIQAGKADFAAAGISITEERRDYDFPGMVGEIRQYCNKNQIMPALTNRIQLAFEESVNRLLVPSLQSPRIQAVIEYSEETENAVWTIRYGGPRFDELKSADGLALAVLKGTTEEMEYSWTENNELQNQLVMKIRNV